MKRGLTACISILFVISAVAYAEDVTVRGRGVFQIDVDVASFSGSEIHSYVEFYYGIRENILSYKADSNRFIGAANVRFQVRNDSAVVASKEWTVPHIIEDTLRLDKGQTMTGIESFGLPFGAYTISVVAYDLYDPARKDTLVLPLLLKPYPPEKEALSDVELCVSVQASSNTKSMFYKNTLEAIPNPSRLYGLGLPILYYYAEAYNLKTSQNAGNLVMRTSVLDASGKEVLVQNKPKPRQLNSSVEVGTVNLNSLKGGTYFFRLSLHDSGNVAVASVAKKFFVFKPQTASEHAVATSQGDYTESEYVVMTEPEIDREFSAAKYVATDIERRQYEQLSGIDAKRKFLFEFWKRRDPDPQTVPNEFKESYKKRVDDANREYTHSYREGWKTEQGRVLIVYGPPDEIERFPSSSESNPYEIWHYNNIQGGVIFVFVDRTGMGNYTLVHSTHRDELRDDSWFQEFAQKTR